MLQLESSRARDQGRTHEGRGPGASADAAGAVKQQLGGKDLAAQEAVLAPVQKKGTGMVQMAQYTSPTDAGCAAAMTAAGITAFGPYIWDDTNAKAPMFKLDTTYAAWTIDDCLNSARYQPEDPTKVVAGEKGKQSLIGNRRKAALKAVFGATQGVVDKIMASNDGKSPRALKTLAEEDGLSGGHTTERHVLGVGVMTGNEQVAQRAAFHRVGGKPMPLDDSGQASVFGGMGDAQAATQAAITNELAANWDTHRVSLAKNTQVKINVAAPSPVVAYTKSDDPKGTAYLPEDIPKYMGGAGDRELYAGHYTGAADAGDAPDTTKTPLTAGGAGNWGKVYVIVDPKASAEGGWAVYTSYPKP